MVVLTPVAPTAISAPTTVLSDTVGIYNVLDYDAIADGASDSTAGITAAIVAADAATYGGIVDIPAGTYVFTNPQTFNLISNVHFRGAGMGVTKIKFAVPASRGWYFTNFSNLTFEGISFYWGSSQSNVALTTAMEFQTGSGIRFIGCEVYNTSSLAVVFNGASDIWCERNWVHDSARDGIHLVYCTGIGVVRDNHVESTNDDGIALWNYLGATYTAGTQYGMLVTGNLVESTGVGRGIQVSGCEGVDVSHNTTKTTGGSGIEVGQNTGSGLSDIPSRRCRIMGNTVLDASRNNAAWGGIFVGKWDGTNRDASAETQADIDIIGNIVDTPNTVGIGVCGVTGCQLVGNSIKDPNALNASGGAFATGIEVQKSSHVTILANRVRDVRGTTKMTYAFVLANVITSEMGHNTMAGAVNADPLFSGTNTELRTIRWDGCRVYNTAAQTLTTGVNTALTFNSERWDPRGMHSTVSNTSRLTCLVAGKYHIEAGASFGLDATGTRIITIMLNGTVEIAGQAQPGSTTANRFSVSTIYDLAVGDYVELFAQQDTGGNLNSTVFGNRAPEFSMVRIA